MFKTIYHFDLNNAIEKQQVCLGKVEGDNKCLAYVTIGGKVMIYSPHSNSQDSIMTQTLNVNKDITCICFGKGENTNPKEYLYIGSDTSLMCYDIESNKTLFDKDIMEGVYCIVCGLYSNYPMPLCIVGGNCSVTGIDYLGEDKFWTILGGNAICMTLADFNEDGLNELLIGTDDFTIRLYQDEQILSEINENTKIIKVEALGNSSFAYALENGTLGLYNSSERVWKVKEKGFVASIIGKDFNNNKSIEILSGWSTGKIQLRNEANGKILVELDIANQTIVKCLYDDFNQRGNKQLICVTKKGDVYGYEYSQLEKSSTQPVFVSKDKTISPSDLAKCEGLEEEKERIISELDFIAIKSSNKLKVNSAKDEIVLPKNTQVLIDLQSNNVNKCADLIIESSPTGTVIHSVIVMSEQIYKGESYVKYPSSETSKVVIQIKTKKDLTINLHIKVLVGKSYYLTDYQVFEFNKIIPKYCFYILLRDDVAYKTNSVQGISFTFNERIDRLILWLEYYFNINKKELESFRTNDSVYAIRFMSLRTDKVLEINVKGTTLKILTEEIELAGNIFQDMCSYFKMSDIDTSFNYAETAKSFSVLIKRIEQLDQTRNQFNINMTEIITLIKDLFVHAEDNRLLQNISTFKDYFRKINVKNLELLDEFEKRTQTYQELIADLKQINEIIQTFSNLKAGTYQSQMVNKCRNCIRKKNYQLLIKIISTGNE